LQLQSTLHSYIKGLDLARLRLADSNLHSYTAWISQTHVRYEYDSHSTYLIKLEHVD
jgi:hypothetical protein